VPTLTFVAWSRRIADIKILTQLETYQLQTYQLQTLVVMPKKGLPPPPTLALPPSVAQWPPAVVAPVPISPFARAPRFNLSDMPRHHAVHPNISSYQVVPGDPNVHPALREDTARGAVVAAARPVSVGETKDRKGKAGEKKDTRRDKEGGKKDRRDRGGESGSRKHREKTSIEPHSQTVEAEPCLVVGMTGPPKGGHKEKSRGSPKGKEKENEDIFRLKSYPKEHLDDPKPKAEASGKPHRSTSHISPLERHQRKNEDLQEQIGPEVLTGHPVSVVPESIMLERPGQHRHHKGRYEGTATKQTHTQILTTPAEVDLPSVSGTYPPTNSPTSIPKPFPIHILLRRITTSNNLSPRQKSTLLTTLHSSLVDISIRTSLELGLAQHYADIAAQEAAAQDLAAEVEDPTPGKAVSLANLKASGALRGYLFGTPGLGPARERSGSETSSMYTQDGMGEAWEGLLGEGDERNSAGTVPHGILSDAVFDRKLRVRRQLGVAVDSLNIMETTASILERRKKNHSQ